MAYTTAVGNANTLTNMLMDAKSLETICNVSSALVQHADKACKLGLVRLV